MEELAKRIPRICLYKARIAEAFPVPRLNKEKGDDADRVATFFHRLFQVFRVQLISSFPGFRPSSAG